VHRLAVDPDHAFLGYELDPTAKRDRRRRALEALRPAQHGADARGELLRFERLRDVVVGSGLEAGDHVEAVRASCHHDDRYVAARSKSPTHLETVEVGKHHV
jgi:hypothetical protein